MSSSDEQEKVIMSLFSILNNKLFEMFMINFMKLLFKPGRN